MDTVFLSGAWPAVAGCLAAFITSVVLVITKGLHGSFSMDSAFGVQKFHVAPTPRIGGMAIVVGVLVAYSQAPHSVKAIFWPILIAGIPALAAGLVEDVTKKLGVRPRLFATMLSGALAWYLTGIAMRNTGVPVLDWMLGFTPFAVLFTAFAVAGLTNAINIVDGFNGLAAGAVAIMLAAMGVISLNVGDGELASLCFILAGVTLGFGAVNWPFGKIFLGDGGAYLLGFMLGWIAVLLPMRNAQLSGWTTLLVCAYPILEVAFSYRRKSKREGHHPSQPDKLHLHMLVYRRMSRRTYAERGPVLQNSLTSPFVWAYALVPAVWGVVFQQHTSMLVAGFVFSAVLYWLIYLRLTQFSWCLTPVTRKAQSMPSVEPRVDF